MGKVLTRRVERTTTKGTVYQVSVTGEPGAEWWAALDALADAAAKEGGDAFAPPEASHAP
jgi:hypothetical protein